MLSSMFCRETSQGWGHPKGSGYEKGLLAGAGSLPLSAVYFVSLH